MGSTLLTGRRATVVIAAIGLAGFGLELRAFWPGLMSTDSFEQYVQAALHRYNDHHPPIMAVVWSLTDRLIPGPGGMLILHLGLLWGGLWAIAEAARRRGVPHAWLIPLVGFLPWIANIAGVIWKDVGMASALLGAGGVLYLVEQGEGRIRIAAIVSAIVLIGYATMVRANGVFAALPLACYAAAIAFPRLTVVRAAAAGAIIVALLLGVQQVMERRILHASPRHLSQLLLLFDLSGMACRGAAIDIPAPYRQRGYDQASLCQAYDPDQVDRLFFFPRSPLQMSSDDHAFATLRTEWISATTAHPKPYLAHRISAFAGLLGLHRVSGEDRYLRQPFMQPNPWGFTFTPNALSSALDASVDALADSGLFSGALWIAVAMLLLTVIARRRVHARFESILLASALTNALPYFFISLAANYRFLYWSVLATSVASVLMLLRAFMPPADKPLDVASTAS